LANNVIANPTNPKYRSVRLANPLVANTLVPAIGAMECLFEMGFEEVSCSPVSDSKFVALSYVDRAHIMSSTFITRRKIAWCSLIKPVCIT